MTAPKNLFNAAGIDVKALIDELQVLRTKFGAG